MVSYRYLCFVCSLCVFAAHLHVECVVVLNRGHHALNELQEDEHVLLDLGRAAALLQRMDDVKHGWAVLTGVD